MEICMGLISNHNIMSSVVGTTSVWSPVGTRMESYSGQVRRNRVVMLSSWEFTH